MHLYSVELSTLVPGQPIVRNNMLVPAQLQNEDHIISAVGWQNNESFASSWMNRVQNKAYLQRCIGNNCVQVIPLYKYSRWLQIHT